MTRTPPAAEAPPVQRKQRQRNAGVALMTTGVAVALLGSAFMGFLAGQRGHEAEVANDEKATIATQAAVVEQQKNDLANATGPVCLQPNQDAQIQALCRAAAAVREAPPVLTLPAERVDYERVRSIVASALAGDPRLQPDALLALVRAVFAANKPADGKTPTDDELTALIRRVLAENPPKDGAPGAPGQDGADGKDGRDGAPGAPGPACPEGFHQEQTTAPDGRPMIACFQDGSTPSPTPGPLLGR